MSIINAKVRKAQDIMIQIKKINNLKKKKKN